jgi:hypothetical protein
MLPCRPRPGEGARIVHLHRDIDLLAVGAEAVPFDDVQLVGVWGAVVVHETERVREDGDGIDDQRVAVLVVAD